MRIAGPGGAGGIGCYTGIGSANEHYNNLDMGAFLGGFRSSVKLGRHEQEHKNMGARAALSCVCDASRNSWLAVGHCKRGASFWSGLHHVQNDERISHGR